VRIIGGALGGRQLRAPKGDATRPTSDKVREAIFNILREVPPRILDLYCGSGAMALEALSRGAELAVLVDRAAPAVAAARANADALGLTDHVQIIQSPVDRLRLDATFDLIFADPPYADDLTVALAAIAPRAAATATIVLEHGKHNQPPDLHGPLALTDRRRYGDTEVSFYRVRSREQP
jgi:16S rRNA (guanine(966)-N(2))-methyltransferase RsmD